ncbi:MAG TPA: DUF1203 domain-containing protein [Thermoanaerobaculia bacterium]|nr:DUF1203 domain-containing protein [Thermoanaerobaculia bacterium]
MHIAPLPDAFLLRARTEGLDDLRQPVKRVIAEGGEPCRDVLRRAEPGEELLLASFTPFTVPGPYKEYGPIFLLANASPESAARHALPYDGYLRDQFAIRAYNAQEEIIDAALIRAADAESTMSRFFAREETAFLHLRFPSYGCFAMRVDR